MYARYTEYLRDIMRNEITKPRLEAALSTYPIYAPTKLYDLIPSREELNKKLLNHWKYREIAFETVGRFLDELEITMCEIMPRYNELFKTVETMAELPSPFDNVDVTETFEQTRTDSTTGSATTSNNGEVTGTTSEDSTSSSTTHGKDIRSDTPGNSLGIGAESIDSLDYASEGNWTKGVSSGEGSSERTSNETSKASGTSSSNQESTGTTTHTYTKKGNQGVNTYAHDMNEFWTSIIDVVEQIINDERIGELFMQVY